MPVHSRRLPSSTPSSGASSVFFSATVQYLVTRPKAVPPNGSAQAATPSQSGLSPTTVSAIRYRMKTPTTPT